MVPQVKAQLKKEFINDFDKVGEKELALNIVELLDDWGFFNMPASTKYHGTREGDLFLHSKNVAHELKRITEACGVEWKHPRSPILVGYFHDLCKCDSYRPAILGKTLTGGDIVSSGKWEYRDDQLLAGHGDKSAILAGTLCKLTEEEMLCIRYHMGAYNTDDWKGFDRAIRKYETVLWTHQADMLASKVVGV